jgi:hypothetical protein
MFPNNIHQSSEMTWLQNGTREWQVQWKGFNKSYDRWLNAEQLKYTVPIHTCRQCKNSTNFVFTGTVKAVATSGEMKRHGRRLKQQFSAYCVGGTATLGPEIGFRANSLE